MFAVEIHGQMVVRRVPSVSRTGKAVNNTVLQVPFGLGVNLKRRRSPRGIARYALIAGIRWLRHPIPLSI